jgi:hypothetical protein
MRWIRKEIDITEWHDWYAWHPVAIGGSVVWFETVKRKWNISKSWDIDHLVTSYYVGGWDYTTGSKYLNIYLAGGMKTDWQDKVILSYAEHTYFDPRSHGLENPVEYTKWDMDHVAKADLVFAYFEKTNPLGFAMCAEIGAAYNAGKIIILVDEKQQKSWDLIRCCCDHVVDNLEDGIAILGEYSKIIMK